MLKKLIRPFYHLIKKVILSLWINLKYGSKPIFFVGTYNSTLEGNALWISQYLKNRKDIFSFVNCKDNEEYRKAGWDHLILKKFSGLFRDLFGKAFDQVWGQDHFFNFP